MKRFFSFLLMVVLCVATQAAVNIKSFGGWFEAGYVTFAPLSGSTDYNVYISQANSSSWVKLDKQLVRKYPDYLRADAVGLKAGQYKFKVVPVKNNVESSSEASTTDSFTVTAHDRSGFAHVGISEGIGAYKNDGTLKDGAKVIYVYADNAKTVSTTVVSSSKGEKSTANGLQDIIYYYQKGYDKTPLDIRIIGTIKSADMDSFKSSAEGLQVKGNSSYSDMPITIEGIGEDAAISGFGILCRNCHGTEFRNFAIILCMDDCLSLDSYNSNIWVHNMDFFYGNTGGDADQAKGDGTVDIKGKSMNCTVSYNHFYDAGKCSLGGMKSETTDCWMTYHHNWFDHSDSRHPRIRTAFYHVYNNYFDGNSKYGVGVTSGGSSFVESNYFRNCKYPMLISKQGTDAEGDGTFSGESGGVIKAYNNTIVNPRKVQCYTAGQTDGKWDAVLAQTRDASISATAYSGGTSYNSSADVAARSAVPVSAIDDPNQIPTIVRGVLGAGRMNHGDIKWTFRNSSQDENYGVISELKSMLQSYKSTLVGFADGTSISNGGATSTVDGGDGKGMDQAQNDSYIPSWGAGGGSAGGSGTSEQSEAVIGSDADYFWTIASNADAVNKYINNGTITLTEGSFQTSTDVRKSDNSVIYSDKVGSLQLKAGIGTATFYNEKGITRMAFYLVRTGSLKGKVLGSDDGKIYSTIKEYTGSSGVNELSISSIDYKYVMITNDATGSLHIQGIKLYTKSESSSGGTDVDPIEPEEPDEPAESTLETLVDNLDLYTGNTYSLVEGKDYTTFGTGTITFKSNNTNVATISDKGVISAVGEGNATITIMQAEDDSYKAGSASFTVIVTKEAIEEPDEPDTPVVSDEVVCHFTGSTPSSNMVSVEGSYSTKKGSIEYKNEAYGTCVKMESSTSIEITPTFACVVTLYFNSEGTESKFKIDGTTYSADENKVYSFEANANQTYTLTKNEVMNLFLVTFTPRPASTRLLGDVNGDGKISISDVNALVRILKGEVSDTYGNADIDSNNVIDLNDLMRLVDLLIK